MVRYICISDELYTAFNNVSTERVIRASNFLIKYN